MSLQHHVWPALILLAGLGQLAIAALNLALVRILRWESALAAMPLLVREVFQVHKYFITVTVALFGVWTLGFADRLVAAEDPLARALAAGMGAFWGIRAVMQVTAYSASHWRGRGRETAVHLLLLGVYGGWGLLYGFLALGGAR